MSSDRVISVREVGASAVLVEVGDAVLALTLAVDARAARVEASEIVPAATTVLFDDVVSPPGLRAFLDAWTPSGGSPDGPLVDVPVTWDGPDLGTVAETWGTDPAGVAARLGSLELISAFCGFAPGFAYLAGLPDELAVTRLSTPRPRVPAGSVALADRWCGIYPTASPGGWRLLGSTDVVLWDSERPSPALLAPGTRVRFVSR